MQILALLGCSSGTPKGLGGWTAKAVSEICGITEATIRHLLQRLRSYDQVESVNAGGASIGKHNKPVPSRRLYWTATEKGEGRLNYHGGHEKNCPRCKGRGV